MILLKITTQSGSQEIVEPASLSHASLAAVECIRDGHQHALIIDGDREYEVTEVKKGEQ